ncbi:MAG: DUF924 domain-containing protein [Deltaproteobacteria bacterium]|nr:DUF924 domain-containing protein [Deltaproteobacteria bacterium]
MPHQEPEAQGLPRLARTVLDFWFSLERPGEKDDALIRAALGGFYEQAAMGALDDWVAHPRGRLALILLVDQVPRHLYRKDARAFATDPKGQHLAAPFFEPQSPWVGWPPHERIYAALPWLHAEHLERQQRVNPVMKALALEAPTLNFAGRMSDLYLETITRFGYFPHRHTLRGHALTPEEAQFLTQRWHPRRNGLLAELRTPPGPEGQHPRSASPPPRPQPPLHSEPQA